MVMETCLPPPPFLIKTYDMVDDFLTDADAVVSWSATSSSNNFVVWEFYEFPSSLLPQFFKHNNLSSSVRQLNIYGFWKADSDRWESPHKEFVRGQRNRLKSIHSKKPAASSSPTPSASVPPPPQGHFFAPSGLPPSQAWTGVGCQRMASRQAESELQLLRGERNVIMLELSRLGGQHRSTHEQINCISNCLQGMEMRQQQIFVFVARTMCTPNFLHQYVNQAFAADLSCAQQKTVEDCLVDSNNSGVRKRRHITYTDGCAIESGVNIPGCMEFNQLLLQQLQQYAEEQASSREVNPEMVTSITNISDDQEMAASNDRKVLVELSLENDSNLTIFLDNPIQGGSSATHNLAYQNRSGSRHQQNGGAPSTTCGGMSVDVKVNAKMKMKMKMKMKQPSSENCALTSETKDHLRMVDLNLHPLNMSDDFQLLSTIGIGNGERSHLSTYNMQVNVSNIVFEDLESELFWEHLLWPVTT